MRLTPATGPIGVLVGDDQRAVRAGFRVLMEREPDLEVVERPTTAPTR
ncbi:MAG: hypothetical protein ABI112_16270 [Terracoccus sp.]